MAKLWNPKAIKERRSAARVHLQIGRKFGVKKLWKIQSWELESVHPFPFIFGKQLRIMDIVVVVPRWKILHTVNVRFSDPDFDLS